MNALAIFSRSAVSVSVGRTGVGSVGRAWPGRMAGALPGTELLGSLSGIGPGGHLIRRLPEGWVRALLCASLPGAGFKVLR